MRVVSWLSLAVPLFMLIGSALAQSESDFDKALDQAPKAKAASQPSKVSEPPAPELGMSEFEEALRQAGVELDELQQV